VSAGGIDMCSCKQGFFTLRDCTNMAATTCTQCTRRICGKHLAEPGLCVECAAKNDEGRTFEDPTQAAVGYRTRWYDRRGYRPMWWGSNDPYYYDTVGYRWYDNDDITDDDGGGFGDS
jgi:hypothetical protein